jgi:ankyrin repeat protein
MKHLEDKNPKSMGCDITPLHVAVCFGHTGGCELIMRQIDEKDPRDDLGWTPLHYIAQYGCVTYEVIMISVENKNPGNNLTTGF